MSAAAQEEMFVAFAPPPMVGSDEEIFSLAAALALLETDNSKNTVKGEKPHQGVSSRKAALFLGPELCNSTTALGVSWCWWTGTALGAGDSYDYDAFGNLSNSTGSTPNNYLFAGEQYDPALALYYNRARYLNTATGRFWGIDTSEGDDSSPISLHKYLYVGANPVDRTDTSGNEIDEVMAGLDIMGTINAISLPNFNQILQSIPRQETLYVRSFAPWDWFGSEPPICAYNCFRGNSRSFTTSRDKGVTSKVTGIVKFLLPSMSLAGSPTAYSDASTDIYGRTATGRPTISANAAGDGKLHMEFAGANPLVPGAPDIDTKLDIAAQ